jgi:F0F1-type ATP synthase assembly protein I
LALGIIFGVMSEKYLIDNEFIRYRSSPLPYFIMIFLMLGVGFVVSFFLHKKMVVDKKD